MQHLHALEVGLKLAAVALLARAYQVAEQIVAAIVTIHVTEQGTAVKTLRNWDALISIKIFIANTCSSLCQNFYHF